MVPERLYRQPKHETAGSFVFFLTVWNSTPMTSLTVLHSLLPFTAVMQRCYIRKISVSKILRYYRSISNHSNYYNGKYWSSNMVRGGPRFIFKGRHNEKNWGNPECQKKVLGFSRKFINRRCQWWNLSHMSLETFGATPLGGGQCHVSTRISAQSACDWSCECLREMAVTKCDVCRATITSVKLR